MVILTLSTLVTAPPEAPIGAIAAPKFDALMSAAVHVVPHKSEAPPKETNASVFCHPAAADFSVEPTTPPLIIRTRESWVHPAAQLAFRSHSTCIPNMVASEGIKKLKFVPSK